MIRMMYIMPAEGFGEAQAGLSLKSLRNMVLRTAFIFLKCQGSIISHLKSMHL